VDRGGEKGQRRRTTDGTKNVNSPRWWLGGGQEATNLHVREPVYTVVLKVILPVALLVAANTTVLCGPYPVLPAYGMHTPAW